MCTLDEAAVSLSSGIQRSPDPFEDGNRLPHQIGRRQGPTSIFKGIRNDLWIGDGSPETPPLRSD